MRALPENPWWTRLTAACLVVLAAHCVPALAQQAAADIEAPLPAGLPGAVANAVRAAKLPPSSVGFFVQDVTATRPALTLNPDKAMNPASVMKLVTTYSALELLGPSYVWKTGFYANGPVRGEVLDGDLVIKGAGDPKLSQEQVWLALKAVRARGVREIRGNIVLERSAFDANGYDAAKFDGDPLRAYNAGPDALLINFKAFALTFTPDESAGTVIVTSEPRGLSVRANVTLSKGACAEFRAYPVKAKVDVSAIQLNGTYSAACGVKTWWLHPYELTHIQYVMARQLFLTVSGETLKIAASAERSARAIKTWLAEKKIGGDELVMENGSGLSRIERISAGALGRMLVAAYRSPVMPEFISSMPLVAYDGTMRRRLKTRDVAGQAHVKTGSLNDVRSIGGYVLSASGRRYAVVFMVNHGNAGASQAAQDALLQWVYAEG